MGNRCCKKKYEPLIEIKDCSLKQITIEKCGNCDLCNDKNVEGFYIQSIIEDKSIFICLRCKKT